MWKWTKGVRDSSVPHLVYLPLVLTPPPHFPDPSPPQAPSSLLEALEQHLASLEGRKLKDFSTTSRYQPTWLLLCSVYFYKYYSTTAASAVFTWLIMTTQKDFALQRRIRNKLMRIMVHTLVKRRSITVSHNQ